MSSKNFTQYWFPTYITILVSGLIWIWISASPDYRITNGLKPIPRKGYLAPEIQLRNDQGEFVTLSDLQGKAVIVNFWASWCPPCRAEMPAIERVYRDFSQEELVILAVNATNQDDLDAIRVFKNELGLTFPILYDEAGKVNQLYQVSALPTTFFINREGIIIDVVIGGPISEALLRARIEQMLKD